jgi:Cu2+-exporting ATPase
MKWSLGRPPVGGQHDCEFRCEGRLVAHFRFSDSLRPDAIAAMRLLRLRKFRLVILSGDRDEKVAAVAEQLGIDNDDAHASLKPEEKEEIVRKIDRQNTLYLGDGANDSLAFNAAWVTGTPVVDRSLLEGKSDFYFMGQGLKFLPRLFVVEKRRRIAVRCAFGFALLYNCVAVSAALAGWMNPLVAAVIMPLSSALSLGIVKIGLASVDE